MSKASYFGRSGTRKKTERKVWRQLRWMWLPAVGLLVVSLYLAIGWLVLHWGNTTLGKEVKPLTVANGVDLRLSASELQTGKLAAFRQEADGQETRFVIMRSADGVVRAAMASCPRCYANRQQNRVAESGVICTRCRHRMHFPRPQEPALAGCSLVKLPYRQEEGYVVISARAVAEATRALREGGLDR